MGILSALFKPRRIENPSIPITPEIIRESMGMRGSFNASCDAGALYFSPVKAVEKFIAESIATLPLFVYRRDGDDRERADDHPIYRVCHDEPNEFQTPFIFWRTVVQRIIRTGNAYVYPERNEGNQIASMLLLDNEKVKVAFRDGQKVYIYKSNEKEYVVPAEQMIQFMFDSDDGLVGVPLFIYAQRAIELGLIAEEYGKRYFTQGTSTSGHIELNAWPTDPQLQVLAKSFKTNNAGLDNAFGVPIVPGGKYVNDTASNEASQFLELRVHQLLEICRFGRVPPYIVQHYENGGTYANLEAQSIDLVQNSLQPWLTMIEEELNAKLFNEDEEGIYFCEFLIDARLRGSTQTRYAAYQIGLQNGFLQVNEVRARENLPEIEIPAPAAEPDENVNADAKAIESDQDQAANKELEGAQDGNA